MKDHIPKLVVGCLSNFFVVAACNHLVAQEADRDRSRFPLAAQVTIHRDAWGVAHIVGETDQAAVFGMGYAQGEDYFWQVEDNCLCAIGRYAEVYGESELRGDLLNRMFEIVRHSQEDYPRLKPYFRECLAAFADGLNYYLQVPLR